MVNIIKMANDRPMEIHDLFVAGMKVKQSQLSADSAYFLMHIILDPDIQPEMFKQMFRGVLTKNNIYHTPEEAFESINSGEVFVFLSKQGPIYMSRIDLANGITNFMSEHYEREDYKVYEEDGFVHICIEQLNESDIIDILMFSLFGVKYRNRKKEVIEALLNK